MLYFTIRNQVVIFRIFNEKHGKKSAQKTRSKNIIRKSVNFLPYFTILTLKSIFENSQTTRLYDVFCGILYLKTAIFLKNIAIYAL